ncbi:MAG: HIT family protein [Patescibacteria group bacterium]|nr:HIT family protein [Patescibacteria group bacterium]
MSDCIFCKIIKKELPSYKVYEDENTLAFLDIAPVNHGHSLVVPKEHYQHIEEIPPELLAKVILVVQKVGQSIKKNLASGYNLQLNNDSVAGQVVPHLHFHVIPRHEGDGLKLWSQAEYPEGKAEEVLNKIKIN